MFRFVLAFAIFAFLHGVVHGADKIRLSMTGFAGQFMTFPLAQKRGFLKEEGFEAEILRIAAAAGRAALTNGDVDYSTGIGGTAINGALRGFRSESSPALCPRRCSRWWRGRNSKPCSRSEARRSLFSSLAGSRILPRGRWFAMAVSIQKRK